MIGGGIALAAIGTVIKGLTDKSPPDAPLAPNVDVFADYDKATKYNIGAVPKLTELADLVNKYNVESYKKTAESLFPGITETTANYSKDMLNLSKDGLPTDVVDLIKRKSAEAGVISGTTGSQFNKMGFLRDLGITSLQYDFGMKYPTLMNWINQAKGFNTFDITKGFVSGDTAAQWDAWNQTQKWNRDWLQNQLDSVSWGWQKAFNELGGAMQSVGVGMLGGSLMGGGGQEQESAPYPKNFSLTTQGARGPGGNTVDWGNPYLTGTWR